MPRTEWQERIGVGERSHQMPCVAEDLPGGRRLYEVPHVEGGRAGWQIEHTKRSAQPGRVDAVVQQRPVNAHQVNRDWVDAKRDGAI